MRISYIIKRGKVNFAITAKSMKDSLLLYNLHQTPMNRIAVRFALLILKRICYARNYNVDIHFT